MLAAMYKFKHDNNWRRFDLTSPSRKDANLQMCAKMEEAAVEHGFFQVPKLCIRKEVAKEDK